MELVVLPLPRLDFKAGQQRCQLREMSIFPPTLRVSVSAGFPICRAGTGNNFELVLPAERHSGLSSAQLSVRTCCLVLMLLVSSGLLCNGKGRKSWHGFR